MEKGSSRAKKKGRSLKDRLGIFGPAILITILGFIVAYPFVEPAPPRKIIIGTGDPSGAYYAFAQRYRELLAKDGITLEIRSTAGSVENVKLLEAREGGVDIAFVQGGIGDPTAQPNLRSLGSLYFEPLWVFYQRGEKIKRLPDLRGKRIIVGPEESGVKAIAVKLLEANGVNSQTATLLPLGGEKAVEALREKRADAAFFVLSPQSPLIRDLFSLKGVDLLSFERGEAYQRANRFLSLLKLPEGVMDFEKNSPDRDTLLLAPAANLVVRQDFHPALADLLIGVAMEVHGAPGLFQELNEFPSQKYLDFPLHKEAQRFFRTGPTFLKKYLPFWAAVFIERAKIMFLPLFTLLLPLMRLFPPGFRWRMRSRIYHWYRNLEEMDFQGHQSTSPEEVRSCIAELEKIDGEVMHVPVPLSYAGELYNLRIHIAHIQESLRKAEAVLRGEGK
ncbi:MAG TPA: TAXI family TRAP transporter solute-binding subunit [Thermodesulfobacteriota bacterium]|nr:TAXI family TRAP transporter solute-binding subunit [Thermodesulfobacteriota bacterium]